MRGARSRPPTLHKGAPWSRRLACVPSLEARVSGGASASTAPTEAPLGAYEFFRALEVFLNTYSAFRRPPEQ